MCCVGALAGWGYLVLVVSLPLDNFTSRISSSCGRCGSRRYCLLVQPIIHCGSVTHRSRISDALQCLGSPLTTRCLTSCQEACSVV
ncbi:hypothetical protein E2C01_063297 [Portunus trituberculatus]|uniref:Secreted protein n=1 Tax=Portunus trituberculatus TaxID=210409 RepID=A0A5B7HFY9_PORTR|nr:hypothetical protein [Portunus trituberculatus]